VSEKEEQIGKQNSKQNSKRSNIKIGHFTIFPPKLLEQTVLSIVANFICLTNSYAEDLGETREV